jgi:hypothetical protein
MALGTLMGWLDMGNRGSRITIWLVLLAAVLLAPSTRSAAQESASVTVTMSASVASLIVPDVTSYSANCRMIFANGKGPNGAAYCVYQVPLTIYVASNESWSGTIVTTDAPDNQGSMTVKSQAVRYTTTAPATKFNDAAASSHLTNETSTWASNHVAGESTHTWYLALRVNGNGNIAAFAATITLTVTQQTTGLSYALTIPIAFNPV